MKKVLYVGSFDPPTIGHEDIVKRILEIFDNCIIGVGCDPKKKYTFTQDERVNMLKHIFTDTGVKIVNYGKQLTCDFAKEIGVKVLVRGVRNSSDYEYEDTLAKANKEFNHKLETVFIPADPKLAIISSSFVKGIIGYENWIVRAKKMVHPYVLEKLVKLCQ